MSKFLESVWVTSSAHGQALASPVTEMDAEEVEERETAVEDVCT